VPVWLSDDQYAAVAAACERLIPRYEQHPGATALGVPDYIDGLLGAFSYDPPHIWAGGPYSGRHGGEAAFARFLPLSRLEEQAWRIRIGEWQVQYRDGLAALGAGFVALGGEAQDVRLEAVPEFKALLYGHACEGAYGAPEYGGNRDGAGWRAISFGGDRQPVGYSDVEVSGPD
jgi:gluconate 2-dehydrogenase gamma chain